MCQLLGAHILVNERKGLEVLNVPLEKSNNSQLTKNDEKFHQKSSGKNWRK